MLLFPFLFFLITSFFLFYFTDGQSLQFDIYRNVDFMQSSRRTPVMLPDWIFSRTSTSDDVSPPSKQKPTSVSLPLYGSVHATAYWFADVSVGSPTSQSQSVIADTGSSVTGFPCSSCNRHCGKHIDLPFNISASASLKPLQCFDSCPLCSSKRLLLQQSSQCAYHIRYTEGSSLIGTWYEDEVLLKQNLLDAQNRGFSIPIPFGCHLEETHLFVSQDASGILGLEATSRFGPPPFITAVLAELLDLKKVSGGPIRDLGLAGSLKKSSATQPVFSMCLNQQGGILTIGSSNWQYHEHKPGQPQTPRPPSPSRQPPHTQTVPSRATGYGSPAVTSLQAGRYNPSPPPQPATVTYAYAPPSSSYVTTHTTYAQPSYYTGTNLQSFLGNWPRSLQEVTGAWTPLVLDTSEEGGWPGSYVAILQGWKVEGAAGQTVLQLPKLHAQRTRMSHATGQAALLDSGTTLTYIPFLLYANLWVAMLKNVQAAKAQHRRLQGESRKEGPAESLVRVSGTSVLRMKSRLSNYIANLQRTARINRRQMKENRHAADMPSVERELKIARGVEWEMSGLDSVEEEQEQITDVLLNEGASKRLFSEIKPAHECFAMSSSCFIEHGASPLRRLVPVGVPNMDEECWYLSNGASDLKYFPSYVLHFANHVEHTWRPQSYLYKKGKADVYCMTIIAEGEGEGQQQLSGTNRRLSEEEDWFSAGAVDEVPPGIYENHESSRRHLQQDTKQVVLGSSFFIGHDVQFHLGRWEVSFAEAACPSTDLEKRTKRH